MEFADELCQHDEPQIMPDTDIAKCINTECGWHDEKFKTFCTLGLDKQCEGYCPNSNFVSAAETSDKKR